MSSLLTDVRWAWRGLRARRVASLAHVVLVALAVGASAVVFSAADAFVFNRAPYPNAGRLVVFERSTPVGITDYLTYEEELALAPRGDLFDGMYAHAMGAPALVTVDGAAQLVRTQDVAPGLFEALGVRPRWGRAFVPGDERAGAASAVVIAEELARGMFGDPAAAPGRSITVAAGDLHVVGVMPAEFRFPTALDRLWRVTDALRPAPDRSRQVIAVLAPGATIAGIEQALERVRAQTSRASDGAVAAVRLARAQKDPRAHTNYGAYTGMDAPRLFATLLAAAICLALVVGLNVAGLELAAALERAGIHGVLTALGATRARLVRTAVVESAILTGAGALAGVGLALWGTSAVAAALPRALDAVLVNPIDLDLRAAIFIATAALAASMLTSVPVVWHLARRDPADSLRRSPTRAGGSPSQSALRHALLTAQIAMCVLLVAGAVLFVRSYVARFDEPKGFEARNLATVEITLPRGAGRTAADVDRDVLARLRAHSAVVAASRMQGLPPYQRGGSASSVSIEGRPQPSGQVALRAFGVDPDTFETMGVTLLSGRGLQPGDGPSQVVVDEAFARRFWPDGSAVGARFSTGGRTPYEIVGVASRVRLDAPDAPMGGAFHVIHRAIPPDAAPLTFVARLAAAEALAEVTAAVRAAASGAVVRSEWMEDRYGETYAVTRIAAGLTGGFGVVSLCVATAGLYGVTAFLVSRRTREIGIRIALGADRRDIRRFVAAPAARAAIVGAAIGTAAAIAGARSIESQLFGVSARDPWTYACAIALIGLTALAGIWSPSARAASVDPAVTLRADV